MGENHISKISNATEVWKSQNNSLAGGKVKQPRKVEIPEIIYEEEVYSTKQAEMQNELKAIEAEIIELMRRNREKSRLNETEI